MPTGKIINDMTDLEVEWKPLFPPISFEKPFDISMLSIVNIFTHEIAHRLTNLFQKNIYTILKL